MPRRVAVLVADTTARGRLSFEIKRMFKVKHFVRYHAFRCWRREYTVEQAYDEINGDIRGLICTRTIRRWYKRFAEFTNTKVSFEDLPRTGRPPVQVNIEALKEAVIQNSALTSRDLAEVHQVSHATIIRLLKTEEFTHRLPPAMPHQLDDVQRQNRVTRSQELLRLSREVPDFFDRLVTCDETPISRMAATGRKKGWHLRVNQQNIGALAEAREALAQRTRENPGPRPGTRGKYTLSVFWNKTGVIYAEIFEEKQRVNGAIYREQLKKVAERLHVTPDARYYLLHDNASPHTARDTVAIADELGFDVLEHPAYSPDIAPSDYHLFRSLKARLQVMSFMTTEAALAEVNAYIEEKNRQDSTFWARGIDALPIRWLAIINVGGFYPDFDGGEHELAHEAVVNIGL